jgi:cytochrome P450
MDNLNHARTQGPDVAQHIGHKSIFHSLLNSNLPPIETTNERLVQEAASVITAGSATTAMALSRTTYELLSRPSELDRLCAELDQIEESQGGQLSVHQLEQLPYLRGVINEGLRLTYGTAHRLMRISPDTPIQYKSWTIPAGTPVGMSNMFMHDNEAIFPSPRSLLPERWLGEQQEQRALERYLVPFSSGSRRCVGANLAYIEILLTLYALFRPGGVGRRMQLSETTIEDVEIYHDLFNAFPKASSRGVRVLIED